MPFVNEYVSYEDAEKYDLDNLYDKYYYWGLKMPEALTYFEVHQHAWCVDKERGYWLFNCGYLMSEESRSGYPEPSDKEVFILHVNSQNIEFILSSHGLGATDLYPIHFSYELVSMSPSSLPNMSRESLLNILKDAINIFKYNGIRDLEENEKTLIEFDF
ncbi:hypothetical protein [Gilliamella apicola]|uniref:hypothetical protein n=4 Tax=Gilliamella apicola TaxID=1196095 RepID=UPI000A04DAD9|nr:hypothetical protein [Gilliamella apicola]ORF43491.1 hypothetical protein B5800_13645 [Gilliamella apicola]ORF48662.1 hypothetical protein B5802_13375 [Gilliamella apicola]ORF51871.1 hypothetical protein B5803_05995 [Gilliamella apicola]ORF56634.1 hypothetical protein B5804_13710 [Gilliamella apicola]ORF59889.1 hypothetical protein B5801_06390 [Gilliamella apicola]